MRRYVLVSIITLAVVSARGAAPNGPTIEQFLSPAYPQDLVSAKKADRIAWWSYERGRRNVFAAAAPDYRPVKLTNFPDDNGVEIGDLEISDAGDVVTFVRGTAPNRDGWVANPTSDPRGADRTVWAARTSGGGAWKLGEGSAPVLSPDGRTVAYAKDGQIYRYVVGGPERPAPHLSIVEREPQRAAPHLSTEKPPVKAWGANGSMKWSPDGTKLAFVSDRGDHSFVGVYDVRTKDVAFLSPGVDHDSSPTWSPDSTRVAFVRRPGTPFGLQAHQG